MKRIFLFLCLSLVVLILSTRFSRYENELLEEFLKYQKDFETIVDYVLENYDVSEDNAENLLMIVESNGGYITSLYHNSKYINVPEHVLKSLRKANEIIFRSTDEFIVVTKERVSFEGLGKEGFWSKCKDI